ncbi:DMT family transporter [Haloterrigena sp. SYSU A558-1]|uniref:DMT family transporter n=1 Tax=Haloterrigena gelatinilytica TaxID=2741724 RepID=A0A8J8GIF1_9EURY|nr:DMT family transporter [Haloterrigena gelatinilytica]NUB90619.1 DMT family transporter [Haloterrigena gelatinilytica]NUC73562.1 DMT family transporter [Haloterrigena gelatinilytica]
MSTVRDVRDLGLLALLWGTIFPAAEIGLSTFPPLLLMALRFDVASLLMIGYVVLRSEDWRPRSRGDVLAIVAGGVLWTVIGNGVWYIGQALTTSVFSGIMTSLVPVLTAGFSWVLLPKERLRPLSIAGLGIGFVGVLVMLVPSGTIAFTEGLLGKAILFGGAGGVALASVLIRYADMSLSSSVQTAWSAALGAVLLHVLSPLFGETWSGEVPLIAGVAVAYLGVISTVVAYLLYFSLLQRRPSFEVTLVMYVSPVVAAITGWLLFGEPITFPMVGGFLLVVAGFSLMKREEIRTELTRYGIVD